MKRIVLLTLLAFVFPTSALANDIDFNTGTFEHGTITSFGKHFRVQVFGSLDTITLNIPDLTCYATRCYFASGTVTVVNRAGITVFTDGLKPGGIPIGTGTTASIFAYLLPDSMGTGGYTDFNVEYSGHKILTGDAEADPVPEPSALEGLLLGTGLLGLAGMARRKLVPGT
jgi:hypothetical protein